MTSDTTDADDSILIGLSRRFLALDGALRLYDRHRVRRDDRHLQQTRDEWQRTLDAITPIRAETEAGRVAKIHAARAAMRHGKDADALIPDSAQQFGAARCFKLFGTDYQVVDAVEADFHDVGHRAS